MYMYMGAILDFGRGETEKEPKSEEVEGSRGRFPPLPSPSLHAGIVGADCI